MEASSKIFAAPANLEEPMNMGYPAKGVVLRKSMLYFPSLVKNAR